MTCIHFIENISITIGALDKFVNKIEDIFEKPY